jgi:hypothetical protein
VCPNRFLRLWKVLCKLWIYLAPILILSPNGPKRDSTRPTSPRSSIGCVQNDFWAYLESRLALYPNRPRRASICASSPRSTIHYVQNNFWGDGTFGVNRAPIMHRNQHYLQKDRNEIPYDPSHLNVPLGACKSVFEAMVRLVQTVDLSCTTNGLKRDSTWPTSSGSSIGCVQNDFWAYGTFGAYCAPILNQDYHCIQTDQNELLF